jgi:hypothetical protein
MKKLLICLLLLAARGVYAQDAVTIKHDFETIVKYTHQKNIDKVIDMTYPPIFKIMPKAQMKAMANGVLSGMGLTIIFEEKPLMLKLSPVKKLAKAAICLGSYDQSMVMQFKDPAMIDMLVKNKMPDTHIEKLDKNRVRMTGVQYLLAIKDANTANTWKYLRYDEQDAAINAKVLSKEIQAGATQLRSTLTSTK